MSFIVPFSHHSWINWKAWIPATDIERLFEKLSSSSLFFFYLLIPWEDLGFYTVPDPFHQETPVREQKLKCDIFFPPEVKHILKCWILFFFFYWQVKKPLSKWNSFGAFWTLVSFVYLVPAWVIFARLKFWKKGIWRETFLPLNIWKFWDTWGGEKGNIQQRKQQKAMRQICNSVNKFWHFQTSVC